MPDSTLSRILLDVLVLGGRDVMREPLLARQELLRTRILPKLGEPIRYSPPLDAPLNTLVSSAKAQRFEGLVPKRADSPYEPGLRLCVIADG